MSSSNAGILEQAVWSLWGLSTAGSTACVAIVAHAGILRCLPLLLAAAAARSGSLAAIRSALLGLHRTGVVPHAPTELDALFAWSAVHGAASLRAGRVPGALMPLDDLAREVATRIVQSLRSPL